MVLVKNTLRSTVQMTHDGKVIKQYRGKDAFERFSREVVVLKHLEEKGCNFVPRLLEVDSTVPQIVTTNCGMNVEHIDSSRLNELFEGLEDYGIRHDDRAPRNVIYRPMDGRFCVIDFEFAERITTT